MTPQEFKAWFHGFNAAFEENSIMPMRIYERLIGKIGALLESLEVPIEPAKADFSNAETTIIPNFSYDPYFGVRAAYGNVDLNFLPPLAHAVTPTVSSILPGSLISSDEPLVFESPSVVQRDLIKEILDKNTTLTEVSS